MKIIVPALSEDEINAIIGLGPVFTNISKTKGLFSLPYEMILKKAPPKFGILALSNFEAQIYWANFITAIHEKLFRLFPGFRALMSEDIVLQKSLRGEALSASEKKHFVKALSNSNTINELLNPSIHTVFAKLPLNTLEVFNKVISEREKSKVFNALSHPKTIKKTFNDSINKCITKLSISYGSLPTQNQLNDYINLVSLVKKTSQKLVEDKTQSSQPKIMEIEMVLPPAKEDSLDDWKNSLEITTASLVKSIEQLRKLDISKVETLEALYFSLIASNDDDLFESIESFCDQTESPFLNDAALASINTFISSWPVVLHPKTGIGIVAHEIGHIVSGQYGSFLMQEKQCLIQKQGSSKYAEEDFADLFAAEVLKQLDYKIGNISLDNFGCGLLPRSPIGRANGAINNSNATDSHSSGFYRLLAIASATKGLTSQCIVTLQSLGENRFNDYCHWVK